ncbi:MAG: C4-dicarboxylate ABC transporter permease [Desulfobacterales bacterium]|nr:MAG: C4-dicarboxylate ABC transporter permease [Desulfobacterales bacterium]
MSPGMFALVLVFLFLFFVIIGVPIGFSLGASGVLGLILTDTNFMMFSQTLITGINNFALLAIPLFVIFGAILEKSRISQSLIELADEIIGFFTGGLAVGTVLASMIFATASGSGPATVAAIGSITMPEMEKRGYSRSFSMGIVASAGALGPIIPPSIPFIIYGVVTEESILRLFLAGLGAGLLFAFLMIFYSVYRATKEHIPRTGKKISLDRILKATYKAKYALGAPVIVLGGIYAGIFTPTEAGAVGCLYALCVGFLLEKTLNIKSCMECFKEGAKNSAMIMFVIANAGLFAWLMASQQIPSALAEMILGFSINKYVFLLLVNLLFLVIGSLLDTPAAIVIIAPILKPIAIQLGIDPIHFGAIIVVNFVIGYITAPFGYNLFVVKSITGRDLGEVSISVLPFLIISLFGLLIITYIPYITLFLPNILIG